MNTNLLFPMVASVILLITPQIVLADSYQEKIEFASSLEKTLGHFWAIEQNLDDGNAALALVHATHPIAELYEIMKPELSEYDPELDDKVRETLMDLQLKTNEEVPREQAQTAIKEAKEVIEVARSSVIGDELSKDPLFQVELIKDLLDTSVSEYSEAVSEGAISEMVEFQDGSAFVWRSEQIFKNIESEIDPHIAGKIEAHYKELWDAYDLKLEAPQVQSISEEIIGEINEFSGIEEKESDLITYVENIRNLLVQAKKEYGNGNNDIALSLVTKAYLDNYEFLENPLTQAGQEDLMDEVEVMLREELRQMIRNGESVTVVDSQIDAILEKMDSVSQVVPEFGSMALVILSITVLSILIISSKSKLKISL